MQAQKGHVVYPVAWSPLWKPSYLFGRPNVMMKALLRLLVFFLVFPLAIGVSFGQGQMLKLCDWTFY